ncbi:MAG: hypothetical protein ACJ8GW_08265, partial [Massilia sp.]
MNIENMIGAIQSELKVGVDGRAGPETWSAIYRRIVPASKPATAATAATTAAAALPALAGDKVDPRSEETIATLLANVQPYARALVHKAAAAGIMIKVISGLRTF